MLHTYTKQAVSEPSHTEGPQSSRYVAVIAMMAENISIYQICTNSTEMTIIN